ncbi:hypothetical protein RIF25_05410 [Thermosynechococcaceae cyanobacterium BACA0444]|uniref:Uncharacterized protein n=1 Tax=Pseudocalidococcus azoricus BACA0444 TaxID=2918990 RepID=A0AAE4FQ52_9CYAN|nr:hypothetical protein [Pseudocalidococcus azoricus]MDS3860239.1 hypothetical protein [Pseudocalidococcus azoricus BACA0444]
MGIAISSFIGLLILTELVIGLRQLSLPLSAILVLGAILAIASNWRHLRAS